MVRCQNKTNNFFQINWATTVFIRVGAGPCLFVLAASLHFEITDSGPVLIRNFSTALKESRREVSLHCESAVCSFLGNVKIFY